VVAHEAEHVRGRDPLRFLLAEMSAQMFPYCRCSQTRYRVTDGSGACRGPGHRKRGWQAPTGSCPAGRIGRRHPVLGGNACCRALWGRSRTAGTAAGGHTRRPCQRTVAGPRAPAERFRCRGARLGLVGLVWADGHVAGAGRAVTDSSAIARVGRLRASACRKVKVGLRRVTRGCRRRWRYRRSKARSLSRPAERRVPFPAGSRLHRRPC
jgi:hypothetical protein